MGQARRLIKDRIKRTPLKQVSGPFGPPDMPVFPNLRLICGRIARKQHHGKIGNYAVVFLGTHPYMARYGRGKVYFPIKPCAGPKDHGPKFKLRHCQQPSEIALAAGNGVRVKGFVRVCRWTGARDF
jgi:hypothetical protein